ncbi:MAG: hypothetical protein EOO94_03495 [Pedobacter sp.]|nr:MAG: hypothetical protein EOO94_03495 [Pedobacter sp.]
MAYDGNGNIQKYLRQGHLTGGKLVMDTLTYKYETFSGRHNRLLRVVDNVPVSRYGSYRDLDNIGTPTTYRYDSIGNIVGDVSESITSIKWTVYGKIQEITRNATSDNNVTKIVYTYDASGNRISSVTTRYGTDAFNQNLNLLVCTFGCADISSVASHNKSKKEISSSSDEKNTIKQQYNT